MGAAVGRCLTDRGHTVLWASEGRGPASARRAETAGLTDAGTARAVAGNAGVIVSVCPPHAAMEVARAVSGFGGLYVDANAVSPGTAREIAALIAAGGGRYVDGGIIGLPPVTPGRTRRPSVSCSRARRWKRGSSARLPRPRRPSRWPTRAGRRARRHCC